MPCGYGQPRYYRTPRAGTDQAASSAWLQTGLQIGSRGWPVGSTLPAFPSYAGFCFPAEITGRQLGSIALGAGRCATGSSLICLSRFAPREAVCPDIVPSAAVLDFIIAGRKPGSATGRTPVLRQDMQDDRVAPKADLMPKIRAQPLHPNPTAFSIGERAIFTISNRRVLCRHSQLISA